MIRRNLYRVLPALIRFSSGASLILVSNFQNNVIKLPILWVMSLSLGISGILFGTLGEYLAWRYFDEILKPTTSTILILLCCSSIFIDHSQIVSQTIVLAIFAIMFQISRIRNNPSLLIYLYFNAFIRVIVPLISEEKLLFKLSMIQIFSFTFYSIFSYEKSKFPKNCLNQKKSSIFGASTLAFNWFLIQQSFTFAILYKSHLQITTAAYIVVLIRIFEATTIISAIDAFNAPNYVENINKFNLRSKILRSIELQVTISLGVFLVVESAFKLQIFANYEVPSNWIFLISTCYFLSPAALHCTPSLLRLNAPVLLYLRLVCVSLIMQVILIYIIDLGNIVVGLILLSLNYNYTYIKIKHETLKVFPND